MKGFATTALTALGILLGSVPVAYAGDTITPGEFHFSYFSVPGSNTLAVEDINDLGSIVGDYTIAGATKGFVRSAKGQLTTIVDSSDATFAGINADGTVVGFFFNTATSSYDGFFYHNGMFTNYVLPSTTHTLIYGINDLGDICGYYQNAPLFVSTGFLSDDGKITSFSIPGSTSLYPTSINDFDYVAGEYQDSSGVFHGFVRDPKGNISTVDVPGASTAANFGTNLLGINNFGWVSGHFTDVSSAEHGFIGVPNGHSWKFFQIDVPGATATSGGGLNDFGTVVGHYVKGGQQLGYIASPSEGEDE
jgi:hypothetical protein